MPKLNTTVKSVRLDNEVLEKLEGQLNGRTFNAWLNEKIIEEVEGKPLKNENNFLPLAKMEEMESMAMFFGVSIENLLSQVCEGLEEGSLTMSNGRVIGISEVDFTEFKKACNGKDPQKVLDEITRKIRSGLI